MARKKKTEEVEPEVIVEETVATETPATSAILRMDTRGGMGRILFRD